MARKRKIPARKHHGIRDPLKQQEVKEKKLANVVNNPPEKSDEQRVSFRFKQFQKLTEASKKGNKIKFGAIGKEDKPKASKGAPASNSKTGVRNIRQFAEETDEEYLKRVNRITSASVREAQYEAKYGVNVLRNPKTGEITVQKRPKNEIDELIKKKQNERRLQKSRKNKKAEKPLMDEKTRKELVKQAIREVKEEQKNGKADSEQNSLPAEYKTDVFAFGEIVHAPPSIKTLPRKATKNETVSRPGQKGNLLLSSMLNPDTLQANTGNEERVKQTTPSKLKNKTPTKIQLKGKRKDLPAATRSMLETEQQKMIALYRQLKTKSTTNKSS